MKYAVWVLTHLNDAPLFGNHEFTCSNCGNEEYIHNYITKDGKHFDLDEAFANLIEEYPYCCKCGHKMKKDSQLLSKRIQFEKSREHYKIQRDKSREPWNIPWYKCHWKVDEVIEKPNKEIPF